VPDMDVEEARRRFAGARVARLATVDAKGHPHLVPVVFALLGDEIVTAVDRKPKSGAPLKRLRNIAANREVCLLVDAYDEDWNRLWWVRADGDARIVPLETVEGRAPDERGAAIAALQRKYAPYRTEPPDGPVTVVAVRRWRGWQAAGPAAGPPG
jgi:PPOX class probable F420-dependent enzyme